jgi:hypothetical protein
MFGEHRPTGAAGPVPELHFGLKFEIRMIAAPSD